MAQRKGKGKKMGGVQEITELTAESDSSGAAGGMAGFGELAVPSHTRTAVLQPGSAGSDSSRCTADGEKLTWEQVQSRWNVDRPGSGQGIRLGAKLPPRAADMRPEVLKSSTRLNMSSPHLAHLMQR